VLSFDSEKLCGFSIFSMRLIFVESATKFVWNLELRPGWNGMFELFLFFSVGLDVGENKKASSDSRNLAPK